MAGPLWEWEIDAANNAPMPAGLGLPEQMAYVCIRNIYKAFRGGYIGQAQASAEKAEVKKQFDIVQHRFQLYQACNEKFAETVRATQEANCRCRKNPTPENAIALCNAVDGIR